MRAYEPKNYDSKQRFASYWDQINSTIKLGPESILEVGVGTGFYSAYLRRHGFQIKTLDLDPERQPDVVGSVTNIPLDDRSFDLAVCCQVLEHIPFAEFGQGLAELRRVSRKHVMISLPDSSPSVGFNLRLARRKEWNWLLPLPVPPKSHSYDGQHHWEIGKKGYPVRRIRDQFEAAQLNLVDEWRVKEFAYHRFFLLQRRD